MAKLTRITGKLFGETATATGDNPQIGQFGSGLAGTYVGTTDVATIQNLTAWSNGFIGCVTPDTQYPPLPEMTGFGKVLSYQQNYLLQQGIAEWDNATTYYINSYVSYNGKIYISLTDNNLNHNPATSTANWAIYGNDIYTNIDLSNLSPTGQAIIDAKANVDLSNLSTAGSNRLHALKGYLDDGEVLTDAEGLADVIKYAHSTFDSTKFTVVGTPTITNDGIASGFSSSNKISKSLSLTGSKLVVTCGFNYINTGSEIVAMGLMISGTSAGRCAVISDGRIRMYIPASGGDQNLIIQSNEMTLTTGDFIYAICEYNEGSTCKFTVTNVSTGVTVTKTGTENWNKNIEDITTIYCGSSGSNNPYASTIDLKYNSITVDGVPVFSGNKTGIDTIKPDDYTVTGTPTISADGVASGLDSSNYITCDCISTDGTIYIPVPNIASDGGGNVVTGAYKISKNSSWTNRFQLLVNTSNTLLWDSGSNFYNQETDKLVLKIVKKGYDYTVYYKKNNNDWVLQGTHTLEVEPTSTTLSFQGGYNVDLNLYKNVINGSVINQPCLKIPYTQSADKYGSKIVDAAYRARVQDAWEQNYPQRYYTLDEANGNFTLPQGEIYGMIGRKAELELINSYDEPNISTSTTGSYNTEYTATQDGWLYFNTHLKVAASINNSDSLIQVYGVINGTFNVYGHMLETVWDGAANTITNDTMNSAWIRIYKGQTYKLYTDTISGSVQVVSFQLEFHPILAR